MINEFNKYVSMDTVKSSVDKVKGSIDRVKSPKEHGVQEKPTECDHSGCNKMFTKLKKGQECIACGKLFCSDHVINSSYVKHLKGLGFPPIEKAISKNGHLCSSCFSNDRLPLEEWLESTFNNSCNHNGCDIKFGLRNFKYSCISCGKFYCDIHSSGAEKVPSSWLKEFTTYPGASRVCSTCLSTKSVDKDSVNSAAIQLPLHPRTTFLKLAAGSGEGQRQAIIVHGILSNCENMVTYAEALIKYDVFDTVWALNDLAYTGRVNEVRDLNPKNVTKFTATVGMGLVGGALSQALSIVDLPAHIIEGAAQGLAEAVNALSPSRTTLIGHSLGGLVVRCAVEVETYDVKLVEKVITLGSPHRLWCRTHGQKKWDLDPRETISYLALLGSNDWVCAKRGLANLTEDDGKHKNITKVIIDGADHTSIHTHSYQTYVMDIVKAFLSDGGLKSADSGFIIKEIDNEYHLLNEELHGLKKVRKKDCCDPSKVGDWLHFKGSA